MKLPKLPRPRLPKITLASDDAVFLAGLALFAGGLSMWQLPAGFIGAGLVLLLIWAVGALKS